MAELEDLESQRRDISQRIDAIEVKIKKKMPLGERTYRHSCPDHKELCEAISDISQEIHDQEMSKDKTGKQKLKIEKEFHSQMARLAECDTRQEVAEKGIVSA
ncbi:hypothetical protein [Gimesia maris]|uniref:hypothetical protein n=1 Tax=Gimesia maris TaxID=122 RepID=UPI0032ECBE16